MKESYMINRISSEASAERPESHPAGEG